MASDRRVPGMSNLYRTAFAALAVIAATPALHAEAVPDPAVIRAHIDDLIAAATAAHGPARLGLVHAVIQLSISYGAPAYNRGSIGPCGDFYATSAAALIAAFPAAKDSSTAAAPAFADLRDGLKRAAAAVAANDAEHKAWTMRCAFDLADLEWSAALARGQGQVGVAQQWFRRGDFAEAALAAGQAVTVLDEIGVDDPTDLPFQFRLAPVYAGQALLMTGDATHAAQVIAAGLPEVPEMIAASDIDLSGMYGDPAHFVLITTKVADAVAKDPGNADLHFLLGYLYRFSKHPDDAASELQKSLAIDPYHAGALALTNPSAGKSATHAKPKKSGNSIGDPDGL